MNEDMTFWIPLFLVLVLTAIGICLISAYFRRILRMQRKLDRSILSRLKTEVETQLRLKHGEQMKSAHLERMKDLVVSDKQVKALQSQDSSVK